MDPKRSKSLLKLSRVDLKLMVEIITGHNNFKTFSTKIKKLDNVNCRYCMNPDSAESVEHILLHCNHFKTNREESKLKRFLPLTTNNIIHWSIPLLLKFFSNTKLRSTLETPVSSSSQN